MKLNLISAVDCNGLIAVNGRIPWKCPGDMRFFREKTMGHAVIMGRKTFESLEGPLDGRKNIVVTRQLLEGMVTAQSLDEAVQYAKQIGREEAFVIGGHNLYYEALGLADTWYLTVINGGYVDIHAASHVYFPTFAPFSILLREFPDAVVASQEFEDHMRMEIDLNKLRQLSKI